MGYRKLSARPRHMRRPRARLRILKKLPHASGRNRAREGDRQRQDRNLVPGRGSYGQKNKITPVGKARIRPALLVISAPLPPTSSARLPKGWQGRGSDSAGLQYRGDEPAPRGDRRDVAPGAHAVLLVDQAGWHLSTRLVVPLNITIIAVPPKCPELNPVENVWQFMRDNWLSNRIFKSYDDLVDHAARWNKLSING